MDSIITNQIKKVQAVQLELVLEVKRICTKNNIKYFLIGGTLLGAIRHNGFIPWDDDLDIGMLRKDYSKFIECSKEQLRSAYFLQTWNTDECYPMPFAKIRKSGTRYVEKTSSKANQHKGIFIDIFPYDNVPDYYLFRQIQSFETYILKRLLLTKSGYELCGNKDYLKTIIYTVIHLFSIAITRNRLIKMLDKRMTLYNKRNTLRVTNIGGSYGYRKESVHYEWVLKLVEVKFENEILLCPHNYHDFLSNIYGDYMKLPPEDKRYDRHKVIELSFSDD